MYIYIVTIISCTNLIYSICKVQYIYSIPYMYMYMYMYLHRVGVHVGDTYMY